MLVFAGESLITISAVFAQNKTALVIGNGVYSHFPRLSNPRNEAISMKNALQRIGFEVILVLDGSEDDIGINRPSTIYGRVIEGIHRVEEKRGSILYDLRNEIDAERLMQAEEEKPSETEQEAEPKNIFCKNV